MHLYCQRVIARSNALRYRQKSGHPGLRHMGSDGTILFASFVGDAIFSVSSDGGLPEAIVTDVRERIRALLEL